MRGRYHRCGIIPGGMEMMDRPAIKAAEDFVRVGYPLDVEALLIVELDGPPVEVDYLLGRVEKIALQNGSTTCTLSQSEEQRLAFWAGRKAAFPAVGRISPDYLCMDGTIPRKELPRVLSGMRALSKNTACVWLMCSMRVMAIFIRSSFMTQTIRENWKRRRISARISCGFA